MKATNKVLIIGAGIAGMETALLLAETGSEVYLLDREPGIGGSLHLLDFTFPTDSCGLCFLEPYPSPRFCPTFESTRHPNIHLIPYAEVEALEGEAGAFTATIVHKPRYVDVEKCNLCGKCAEVCPVERPHPYEGTIAPQKAIYKPALRAIPSTYVIDMDYCTRCGKCVEACPTGAIDLNMPPQRSELQVGSVVIAAGYEPFPPELRAEFGYGVFRNVLTSLEFERMVSFSGSTHGRVVRPSDGKPARKIAFVHCVGSRDPAIGRGYCSSVCCMHTAKQVTLAKERDPKIEATVFYMDLRPIGKVYDRYIRRVQQMPGVRYIRSIPSGVFERHPEGDILVRYIAEDGTFREEVFDIVVLALGFGAPRGLEKLGIEVDKWGFPVTRPDDPHKTTREGVFVAGAARRPMDIPDTVVDAAATALEVKESGVRSEELEGSPHAPRPTPHATRPSPLAFPDLTDAEPHLGVFIFTCRELAEGLDLKALEEYASTLAEKVTVHIIEEAAGSPHVPRPTPLAPRLSLWDELVEKAKAEGVNRLIVATCRFYPTLDVHEKLGSIGPYEIVPLLEQAVLTHPDDREAATREARALLGMAASRLLNLYPYILGAVSPEATAPEERALVIGGGLAGMTAALSLADLGYTVDLVEREAELGGLLRIPRVGIGDFDPARLLASLRERVQSHPRIAVHLNAEVTALAQSPRGYAVTLKEADGEKTLPCGAIILATGGREAQTTEYLYGRHPRVITQLELERELKELGDSPHALRPSQLLTPNLQLVMIQCVGSRDDAHPYCSRVCCYGSIKNALAVKELNPEAQIYVFYRDIVAFGPYEELYTRAREKGIIFIPYTLDNRPQVEARGKDKLLVRLQEPTVGEVEVEADLVVLSVGIEPGEDTVALAGMLGLAVDEFGFFAEEHVKMRPLDLPAEGMFVCGLAQGPHLMEEVITQGKAAAFRAALHLQRLRELPETIATVNERLCSGCELCVSACPYSARVMDEEKRVAIVLTHLCRGCGVCAMVCPNGATQMRAFDNRALLAVVDAALVG